MPKCGLLIIGGQKSFYDVRGLKTRFSPIANIIAGLDVSLFRSSKHHLLLSNLLNFSSSYFLDDFNREKDLIQSPFAIWNLSLIYRFFKHYEMMIFGENITNSTYATSAIWDGKGRAYTAGNSFNLGVKFSYRY